MPPRSLYSPDWHSIARRSHTGESFNVKTARRSEKRTSYKALRAEKTRPYFRRRTIKKNKLKRGFFLNAGARPATGARLVSSRRATKETRLFGRGGWKRRPCLLRARAKRGESGLIFMHERTVDSRGEISYTPS